MLICLCVVKADVFSDDAEEMGLCVYSVEGSEFRVWYLLCGVSSWWSDTCVIGTLLEALFVLLCL
jgi:hypothetical protein